MKCRAFAFVVRVALWAALAAAPVFAQDPPLGVLTAIGVDQNLDERLPFDLIFNDEDGREAPLGRYFRGKPVVLSLVYYECSMLCSMTLNGLLRSVRALSFDIGDEFDILTISIDPRETADIAADRKEDYVRRYGREGARSGWRFLTGSAESIERLADAVGYRYQWDEHGQQWAHPSAIMTLTPDGRLSQYLYGIEFSARDLRLSLIQAGEGRIGSLADRVLLYCFAYDPTMGRYGLVIMNVLRLAGIATVLALAAFIIINRA